MFPSIISSSQLYTQQQAYVKTDTAVSLLANRPKHVELSEDKINLIYWCIWLVIIHSSRWRYSPGWALASATICLQASRFLALSLRSLIPIFLRSVDTSSSHLILGLSLRLVAYSFPYRIFLGLLCLAFFLYAQAIVFFGI